MNHKLKTSTIQTDTTIRLIFENGSWANMSFIKMQNNWTNVVISSDWGNWSYGWGESGHKSYGDIFAFFAELNDLSYFTRKFIGAEKELFSAEKTCTGLRKIVRKEYPWIKYKDENENFMEEIKDLEGHEELRDFMDDMSDKLRTLVAYDDYELYQLMVYERHPRTAYFFKNVFPLFFKDIKKIHKERQSSVLQFAN